MGCNSYCVKTALSPSDVWVGNLAQEEDVPCAVLSDNNHERTVELQDWDVMKREKCDHDAGGSCGGGSSLIHIQGSLMNNLQKQRPSAGTAVPVGRMCTWFTVCLLTPETDSFCSSEMPVKSAPSPNMSAIPISVNTSFSEDDVLMENFGTKTSYCLGSRFEDKREPAEPESTVKRWQLSAAFPHLDFIHRSHLLR